jgi:misacylated tRNA(Ala) deacylase
MSGTELLFRDDPYLAACEARIVAATEGGGLVLDRTVFYAAGGGQPGDAGAIELDDGIFLPVASASYAEDRASIVHQLAQPLDVSSLVGRPVTAHLDWARRYAHMRIHTALHLLSVVLPYPVTGGQIGSEEGRLDFDIPDGGLEREEIAAKLNALAAADHPVTTEWITDEELIANPALVKTMAVKPPMGSGRVRLVRIGDIDLQPCGGTHVASTAEIGAVEVTKIEKKGRQNRRVRIGFAAG